MVLSPVEDNGIVDGSYRSSALGYYGNYKLFSRELPKNFTN